MRLFAKWGQKLDHMDTKPAQSENIGVNVLPECNLMSIAWSLYLPYPSSTSNHIWYEYPSWPPSVCVWGEWIEDVATMWFKDPHEFPDLWLPRVVGPTRHRTPTRPDSCTWVRLLHVGQTPARGCVVVQQFPAIFKLPVTINFSSVEQTVYSTIMRLTQSAHLAFGLQHILACTVSTHRKFLLLPLTA